MSADRSPEEDKRCGRVCLVISNRGPMAASGICRVIARRGGECGVEVFPHRIRRHFTHTWLDCGRAEGGLMELSGWTSPQMHRRCGASARSGGGRRSYDRIVDGHPVVRPRRQAGRLAQQSVCKSGVRGRLA